MARLESRTLLGLSDAVQQVLGRSHQGSREPRVLFGANLFPLDRSSLSSLLGPGEEWHYELEVQARQRHETFDLRREDITLLDSDEVINAFLSMNTYQPKLVVVHLRRAGGRVNTPPLQRSHLSGQW